MQLQKKKTKPKTEYPRLRAHNADRVCIASAVKVRFYIFVTVCGSISSAITSPKKITKQLFCNQINQNVIERLNPHKLPYPSAGNHLYDVICRKFVLDFQLNKDKPAALANLLYLQRQLIEKFRDDRIECGGVASNRKMVFINVQVVSLFNGTASFALRRNDAMIARVCNE